MKIEGYGEFQLIGTGSFGDVYRAREYDLGRDVAIKVLRLAGSEVDDTARRRFNRECRAMGAASSHPNIVTVHQNGFTESGNPFIVMDYYSSGTVLTRLKKGALPLKDALRFGIETASALATAHAAGIVHFDVKPENLLLSGFDEVALGDFGISHFQGSTSTSNSFTVAYAAPEQLDEGIVANEQADVYSLGATLFTFLTAYPPFRAGTTTELVAKVLRGEPPALAEQLAPNGLSALITRLLDKDPSVRPTAAEAAHLLQSCEKRSGLPATRIRLPKAGTLDEANLHSGDGPVIFEYESSGSDGSSGSLTPEGESEAISTPPTSFVYSDDEQPPEANDVEDGDVDNSDEEDSGAEDSGAEGGAVEDDDAAAQAHEPTTASAFVPAVVDESETPLVNTAEPSSIFGGYGRNIAAFVGLLVLLIGAASIAQFFIFADDDPDPATNETTTTVVDPATTNTEAEASGQVPIPPPSDLAFTQDEPVDDATQGRIRLNWEWEGDADVPVVFSVLDGNGTRIVGPTTERTHAFPLDDAPEIGSCFQAAVERDGESVVFLSVPVCYDGEAPPTN